jgi:hypothetical protein
MSNLSLYQIAAEYRAQADALEQLDLDEQTLKDTLESFDGDITTKAQNYAFVIKNMEAHAEQVKQAAAGMTGRAKKVLERVEHIKAHLLGALVFARVKKVESPYFTLTVRDNNPAVIVFDEKQIPLAYMRIPEPPPPPALAPDKAMIAAALKAGIDVPGCRLERGQRIEIRV